MRRRSLHFLHLLLMRLWEHMLRRLMRLWEHMLRRSPLALSAVMLADAGASAVLAGASDAVIRCPCPCSTRGYARRCRRPRSPALVPLAVGRALLTSPRLCAHPVPLRHRVTARLPPPQHDHIVALCPAVDIIIFCRGRGHGVMGSARACWNCRDDVI